MDGSPESALRWISSLKENYLLVLDNLDVLLSEADLAKYLPPELRGNILISSCNYYIMKHLTSPVNSYKVKLMEVNDATELLLKAGGLDPFRMDLQAEASIIVKELSCLPLAIVLAGGSISSGVATLGDYIEKYSHHYRPLVAHPEFKGASKCDRTVYGNCELLYEEIQQRVKSNDSHQSQKAKSAMILLGIFAFFHHEGIMEDIFSYVDVKKEEIDLDKKKLSLASSQLNYTFLPFSGADTLDGSIFEEGVHLLASLQFIKLDTPDGTYTMHPLIHGWARKRMTADENEWFSSKAQAIFACAVENDENQSVRFRRALVTHVVENMEQSRLKKHTVIGNWLDDDYEKFLWLFGETGYLSEAEKLGVQILDARSRTLGEDHPDTVISKGDLAAIYSNLGKYTEAEKLQIQVLDARSRIQGEEDLHTLMSADDLALTCYDLGKYKEAEKLQIQGLNVRRRILGEEHPHTIMSMGNLALTYSNLGRYTDTENLQVQVVDAKTRILGEEHPQTIMSMGNLALTYNNLGKYTEAEKLQVQVMDEMSRILGEEHLDAIMSMDNLASTYSNLGKYTEAEKLQVQVLGARSRILGEEHLHTVMSMGNLALTYGRLGKHTEAEKLQVQVLDATKGILGEEHPHTIMSMGNLALTFSNLGRYTEAKKLQVQVLDARRRILGEEHPHTIMSMGDLASTYSNLGKYTEAEKLQVQVLDARRRILGEEHPDTVMSMDDLAVTYNNLGKYTDAEKLQVQVLDRRRKILGEKHPHTIMSMGNVALTYRNLGKYTEAEKLWIQVVDARSRILGEEHPDTVMSKDDLVGTYSNLGKYTEAEKLQVQVLDARSRILGEEHPDTIMSMGHLALTYSNLGKYTEAEKLQVQVLSARSKILGEEHLPTIMSMDNLALTYCSLGRYTEAEKLQVQVLDARNRILGEEHPATIMAMKNLAVTYGHLKKYTAAEKLKAKVLNSRIKIAAPEHPDAMASDIETKCLQSTVADKLQAQVLDAGKEVATLHPFISTAMTNFTPNGKQLVLVAKTALRHLQHCEAEIKAALSISRISERDYILLAGFNESVIQSGIGYLEEIHVVLKSEFSPDSNLLSSLGRLFSPFPGMIFTTCQPYCFKTLVFNSEGKAVEWDEVLFVQAHTYTTLRMENTMREMALMSANICTNGGQVPSGSGSGGGGDEDEKKQGENMPQGGGINNDPQRGSEKDSEGDDNDKGDDPDNPDVQGSSGGNLPEISFNIQTEIYPYVPPVLASQPSSSKSSKRFQLLQLEGSITVQVGFL